MTTRQYAELQRQAEVIEQHTHSQIEAKLKLMQQQRQVIHVQLWPPQGESTIQQYGNRMYINEGQDGEWTGVSEAFYDSMVRKYDSRS